MAKRSNPSVVSTYREPESVRVSVRKIDNGFLVTHSTSGPKGYKESEFYHPTKPKLDMPTAKPAPAKKPRST